MKTYTGKRNPDGTTTVTVTEGEQTYDLHHHVQHSPTGFEWGYGGSGPSDLARCILIDYFGGEDAGGEDMADRHYQRFKFERIAVIGSDTWEITSEEVGAWVRQDEAKERT